jgi:hypothetical protein
MQKTGSRCVSLFATQLGTMATSRDGSIFKLDAEFFKRLLILFLLVVVAQGSTESIISTVGFADQIRSIRHSHCFLPRQPEVQQLQP